MDRGVAGGAASAVGDLDRAQHPQIISCRFSPTGSSLLATTPTGFIIYNIDKDGIATLHHEYDVGTPIRFAERLYATNLVAYATVKNPDVFVVFHCKKRKIICDFRYPSDINIIRFNRQRVVIAIKDVIYIHNVRNMQIVHLIKDAPENPRNLMELAVSENCGYLAFPGKIDNGSLRIFDVFQLQDVTSIQASTTPLTSIRFDPTGARIATASIKGTCIRVYDSQAGNKLYEFRRGMREVRIVSLSFSLDSRFLSATSGSETVHIFKLADHDAAASEGGGFFAAVRETLASAAGGLLSLEERAVTTIQNPLHGHNAQGFLGSLAPGCTHFLLMTPTGLMHVYVLLENTESGATVLLKPIKQQNLREVRKVNGKPSILSQDSSVIMTGEHSGCENEKAEKSLNASVRSVSEAR
ncbi:WD repeat domain phosphoinositide-interacting protein 2-like [Paramacrobiotus metropolitanus]|uniref:WD repeat domain phosphoinositide-interacting protein 2-like n=1 Tax=Paramacrobiotus metropolitanus TaxID=2943436 RepID=UPI0024464046|nr:WD repeat domain phosphoinositide-interacting protein 2-like [Paramacrobiotus metropolitanus]